jgi:hypothetical protein
MNKPWGCLSLYGLLASLVLVLGVGAVVWLGGAAPLSPGPLTASAPRGVTLQGHTSHADMEQQCTLCHRPWAGVDPARCAACHTAVQAEIAAQNGLHGQLKDPMACATCHPDHQGREVQIALARPSLFPHDLVGFTLRRHTQLADGTPFSCENCHTPDYALLPSTCDSCHQQMDAAFMEQHIARYGESCISCHDGSTLPAPFDHQAVFPLDGAHAQAECAACHSNVSPLALTQGCTTCHEESRVHGGQFGAACEACHTTQSWRPALLRYHAFPLGHGEGGAVPCLTCHPTGYASYSCYGCHAHQPAETEAQHREEGIADLADCASCHPAGTEEGEER